MLLLTVLVLSCLALFGAIIAINRFERRQNARVSAEALKNEYPSDY